MPPKTNLTFLLLLIVGTNSFPQIKFPNNATTSQKNNTAPKQITNAKPATTSNKSFEPEMVKVEGGTFTMGQGDPNIGGNDISKDEQPAHRVTLSSFKLSKFEVTHAQWKAVIGNNPSSFSGCDNCPVETVSWEDAQKFIAKLNSMTGKHYRLPTEAEWEYAARGGKYGLGYKYSGNENIGNVAWYKDNSGSKTHAVGQKQPNELGLYDMTGNVMEWCADWYNGNYYSRNQSSTNPKGPGSGEYIVTRGGSWSSVAVYCRVSFRGGGTSDMRASGVGFRLAQDL